MEIAEFVDARRARWQELEALLQKAEVHGLQRLSLEWLFRFASSPRRLFRRYVIDSPVVIALLARQRSSAGRTG